MEFDGTNIEFVQADPEMLLEVFAKKNHHDTSAAVAHQNIATQLWPQLRGLEYATGQLLAVGEDVDLLAGASPDGPRPADSDNYEEAELLAARMPPTGRWPHQGLRLRSARNHEVGAADLVLANLPLVDARALTRSTKTDVVMFHHGVIRDALTWLRPGGLLVAIAHRQLLEGTDPQPRRSIAKHADLIGAVRLPASALRQAPLLDSPVDLLMLRRRESGHPPAGLNFIGRSPVHIHDAPDMLINDCYANAPWAAAGNIVPDPIDPDMTTVAPMGGDFGRTLSKALATHVDIAIDDGLYAKQRPASRAHPAPQQDTPHGPSAGPDLPAL